MTTWILVADSSRARFFRRDMPGAALEEFSGMTHAESRLHEQEEYSDRQGDLAGGHDEGPHSFEAETGFREHQAEVFARQIADRLEQGRVEHQYRHLVLIAPPAFLGAVRNTLNSHVLELVSQAVDKNLVTAELTDIAGHLL